MKVKVIFSLVFSLLLGTVTYADLLKGSGSTLAYPVMAEYVNAYTQTHAPIGYAPVGSYVGVEQFLTKQVAFAVSDVPLKEMTKKVPEPVVEVPFTVGATAIVFKLPETFKTLKLTPALLVQIFSGKITQWNDPALVVLNKHLTLPNLPIKVIVRSDQSGTSYMLSHFFAKQDKSWAKQIGVGSVFPTPSLGIGVTGSDEMAATVANTMGAIGYVEWHFAHRHNLGVAAVQNPRGQFVLPNLDSIRLTLSLEAMAEKSLVASQKDFTYPICGFTWLMVYQNAEAYGSFEKSQEIMTFLKWTLQEGQLLSESMDYPALPAPIIKEIHQTLRQMNFQGIIVY